MSNFEILAIVGLVGAVIALLHILIKRPTIGNPTLAALLSIGFAGFTAFTISKDGLLAVWVNHTTNYWGTQVWWDLLFSVLIAFFFIAPRARQVGMNIPLWALFVASTASIGLLAMIARLFWLEKERSPSA